MPAPPKSDKYTLYQRDGSANWYVRFSIKGQGQIRKSLETDDRDEAETKAYDAWRDAVRKDEQGLQVRDRKFADVAQEYIEHIAKLVERGEKPKHFLTLDVPTINRYFVQRLGNKTIDRIGVRDITDYTEWRAEYWQTGPGAGIAEITYERAGRRIRRPVYSHDLASPSRLKREAVMLRQVFEFARKRGYITVVPLIETIKAEDNPRATFTATEFKKLNLLALSRATQEGINRHLMHERRMLFAYINLLAYSGMRVEDVNDMNWSDVRNYEPPRDDVVRPPTEITLSVRAKKHPRIFIPHPHCRISFDFLYKAWVEWMGKEPQPNDPLFFNSSGQRVKSFAKGLKALLIEAGLEKDHRGFVRSAKSFRHFYISQMLVNNVDVFLIAQNVGSSPDMIKRFYAAVDIHRQADKLRGKWEKST